MSRNHEQDLTLDDLYDTFGNKKPQGSFYDLFDKKNRTVTPSAPVTDAGVSAWADKALSNETGRVATAPKGTRNSTLFTASAALGEIIAGGHLNEGPVRDALTFAAHRAGLGEDETANTIASGFKTGAQNPRSAPANKSTSIPTATVLPEGETVPTMTTGRRVATQRAADIRTEMQHFFWADRIPTGTLTFFAGRGGEGKSTFAFHVAAEITKGTLPGAYHGSGQDVLIWSGEDRWETVIIPRLIAAGADLNRVHRLAIEAVVDGDGLETTPNLPDDLPLVREAVETTGAKLVIFDPIASTMRGNSDKEGDVRLTLDGLARIAHATGIVVLAIRHFNKGQGNASDKMTGSHAFRDAARSVFLFATDTETEQRVLTQDKGNYSKKAGESLAFTLESVTVHTDDGHPLDVAKVVVLGETELSVSQIINRDPDGGEDQEDRNAAQAFILDYLEAQEDREARAGDVIKAGRAAGFNENEIKNARRRSRNPRIESRKSGFGAGWVWGVEDITTLEDVTKVPKVSVSENATPSTPSVTPSPAEEKTSTLWADPELAEITWKGYET